MKIHKKLFNIALLLCFAVNTSLFACPDPVQITNLEDGDIIVTGRGDVRVFAGPEHEVNGIYKPGDSLNFLKDLELSD